MRYALQGDEQLQPACIIDLKQRFYVLDNVRAACFVLVFQRRGHKTSR
jgi:hypothetical protein